MSIQEQLTDDLKKAMKSHDEVTKGTIRLIRAAIQNAEIEKRNELDDTGSAEVLSRMAKQYRDSIKTYGDAGRADLVAKEEAELLVLLAYLPEQMSADEILALAKLAAEGVGATGPGDRGKVMGKLMPQLRGKADGSLVNTVVGKLLDSLAAG